jgi:hypothetical protein
MDIIKFNEYLKEISNSKTLNESVKEVVNIIITNIGNINQIKASIERGQDGKVTKIVGSNSKEYQAGIYKNGKLICINFDENGYLLIKNSRVKIHPSIIKRYKYTDVDEYWNINDNYSDLLPTKAIPKKELSVLDILIDSNGEVYNGSDKPLIKGNVERKNGKIIKILGIDNKVYSAGIDKNGNLIGDEFDKNDNLIINNISYPQWNRKNDYIDLIPLTPTGWVNVKVDMELVKRVRRYSTGIGSNDKGIQSFRNKLNKFEQISNMPKSKVIKSMTTIQQEMSVIIMLHYINEIKDFFHPSSAGFIFESFLAGLIPNAKIVDDNGKADLISNGKKYQVKFLSSNASDVEVTIEGTRRIPIYMDYYLICLKYIDKIEIYIIDGKQIVKENKLKDITTNENFDKFSLSKIKQNVNKTKFLHQYTIDLSNIENKIDNIGDNLKGSLNELYSALSKFQYNVETLISGVTPDGLRIKEQEQFEFYYKSGSDNIDKLNKELINLKKCINPDPNFGNDTNQTEIKFPEDNNIL